MPLLDSIPKYSPPKQQLLKWIGNKQKFAGIITRYFPSTFKTYYEPFLGSGAILGTISPSFGIASDTFSPLIEIWRTLKEDPALLVDWYRDRRVQLNFESKESVYERVRNSYNSNPNGADFLYLSRSCYGGVIRFRKSDGYMSTPCGAHTPIPVEAFKNRVEIWHKRVANTIFVNCDYTHAFHLAQPGDLIYCDPPYSFSQSILYGAQDFNLGDLFASIAEAKSNGIYVALSIDGNKKSGNLICDLPIPDNLFETEILVDLGISMLKRFQMEGEKVENEDVADRLLLTYKV